MLQILLAVSLATQAPSLPPCDAEDVTCLRDRLNRKAEEVESLMRELDLAHKLQETTSASLAVALQSAQALDSASRSLLEHAATPAWYQSPLLWLGVGVLSTLAFVLAGWALVSSAAH